MKQKVLLASFALCLCLFGSKGLSLAQNQETPEKDPLEKMMAEGWRPVAEGVLQRSRGENKVETFTFGPEGFQRVLQDLEKQHAELEKRYETSPTPQLRKAIRGLRKAIAETREILESHQLSSSMEKVFINGCDVSYGAHADAYPLSPGPGVGATADSYFHNDCGNVCEVYSYAYGFATNGSTRTSASQVDGPKSGTNISAYASISIGGRQPCHSEAYSYVSCPGLGIFFSSSGTNDQCPDPPLVVSITPPTSPAVLGYNCKTLTWTASVSGGIPGYSYAWYRSGANVGSGSSYSAQFCGDNTYHTETVSLFLTVTDSVGTTASAATDTVVQYYEKPVICCPDPFYP